MIGVALIIIVGAAATSLLTLLPPAFAIPLLLLQITVQGGLLLAVTRGKLQ